MLNNLSVQIGTNLAEIFANENILLVAKPSSLMLELVSSIENNIFSKVDKKDYVPHVVLNASLGTNITHKGVTSYTESTHDTIMDNYIESYSRLLAEQVSFARSVVNKEVLKLKESLEEALNGYRYKDAEEFFNVKYFKPHDVFNSYLLQEEIKSYKDSATKFFYEKMPLDKLRRLESFELEKYILVGDEEQDTLILSWFNIIGKDKALSYIIDEIPEYFLGLDSILDYSLINYLFFRNLTERTDLNLDLTTLQLKTKAAANRDYFGNKLSISLKLYAKDIKNGKLLTTDSQVSFSYFNKEPLNITVYEESFAKLAEQGGNIELLFGYISNEGKNNVTVDILINNKDKYINSWNNIKSLYLISINNSKLDIFKNILGAQVNNCFKDLTEAEKEVIGSDSIYLKETENEVKKYINELELSDIEDLETICLDLVAKIRFRFSNAYYILKEMKEILNMNSEITPMEAALYSTIKYISDVLIEQVDIVRN